MNKIIAVDFDNTLAITNYPEIVSPIANVVNYIKSQKAKGSIIILNTCRHNKELEDAVNWCYEQGVCFDFVNENHPDLIKEFGDCRKIAADEYIDDKNILIAQI